MNHSPPTRVLHVVGGMSRGGVETWLMHLLRSVDRSRTHMDFLAHTTAPGAYDAEIRSLGSSIHICPWPHRPLRYSRELQKILRENPPYDVIHSHVHHFSGWALRVARKAGIPVRIAHSHNDTREQDHHAKFLRKLYLKGMTRAIEKHATLRLAASREAGACLFGNSPPHPPWQVLYCGIDLKPFTAPLDRLALRQELGLPANAFVVGHVGRFMEQKNHAFLLDIAQELARLDPDFRLVLVGEGPLQAAIQRKADDMGLSTRILFLGSRPDVPRILRSLDVFLLPSLHEGLPLVGMEAQAAGVPLVLTDTITSEVQVIPDLVRSRSLSDSAKTWAETVRNIGKAADRVPQKSALERMERSPFNIRNGLKQLEELYESSAQLV